MICYKNKKSRCRCSTSAYFSRDNYEELLRFIDNGGTVAEWDRMKKSNIDKSKKSGIIKSYKIRSPINHKNTGKGKPSAIIHYGKPLNNRQQKILESLPKYDSRITVEKSSVSMTDLSALTANIGVEFALFTNGNKRLIVRGNANSVNITIEEAKKLAKQGYKWSGHTHPGIDDTCLFASDGDITILKVFNQQQSVIYNSKGQFLTYEID